MINQNQQVFKDYLNETERWCIEVFTANDEVQADWLRDVRNILEQVQGINQWDTILESDILHIQKCMHEMEQELHFSYVRKRTDSRVPIGEHKLPPLPYRYDALEPYISREIMEIHHLKHHQSYVEGLNKAEKKMKEARETGNFELIKHWEREAAFHGSGHYLHTMFWENMTPNGGGGPRGALLHQINQDFGSYEQFKHHFSEAADKVEGVGWAILVWSPRAQRLEILQTEKQQLFTQWDTIPLLGLDVWEHAYYLQYKNERKDYIDNWWNIVNWKDVERRFQEASKLKWKSY